nr:hypothetical protein [Cronobacter sakazakii]
MVKRRQQWLSQITRYLHSLSKRIVDNALIELRKCIVQPVKVAALILLRYLKLLKDIFSMQMRSVPVKYALLAFSIQHQIIVTTRIVADD